MFKKKEKSKEKKLAISNELEVAMPIQELWDFFDDTSSFAEVVPTLIEYTILNENQFEGKVGVTLGRIPIRSRLEFSILEKEAPHRIYGEGVSYLGESLVNMKKSKKETKEVNKKSAGYLKILLNLSSLGDNKTLVKFNADIIATGRLKKIYESIIRTKIPALKQEYVDNMKSTLKVAIVQLDEKQMQQGA